MVTWNPKANDLFLEAVEKPPGEYRAAYLDEVCGTDADLRAQVDSLLAANDRAGNFLESPAADLTPTTDQSPITERPGTVIGPYKLLQQIGEGGMGVVFMAEQTEPIQRTVALKIIKPGMDTRQVISRFEAERQALALMDHPNIARVLDAGVVTGGSPVVASTGEPPVSTGRPYFVMELVKGIPITQYCDEKRLPLRERLELFVPVCHAVQHAHQKGVIHRDIKPTNVLVAEYDNHAVPKVIDFGVAKATAQKLTERTMFTEFGQVVGTFEYMSPEQAKLNQLDIDTRSDIYALGVLLYELITGETPFDRSRLHSAPFDEILRIIREEEPPKPSTRLTTLGQQAASTVSARRSSAPDNLRMQVQGELDWIVMKCLEKERSRRYESANALAADIKRYLNDEPVQACSPTAGYRLRKFARRNKVALAIASLALTGLCLAIVGLATTTFVIARANDGLQQALNRERRTAYFQSVALAEREWSAGNLSRAVDLLNQCPQDLRGWEWQYLKRLSGQQMPVLRNNSSVFACAVSPDGSEIAAVDEDGYMTLWDIPSGAQLRRFRGHENVAWCVVFSPDGERLATGDRSGNVKIWDAQTAEELRAWQSSGPNSYIGAVGFSPDGRRLACAYNRDQGGKYSSIITLHDPVAGEQLLKLPEQTDYIMRVAFSADGRRLAAACTDDTVRVSDALTGETVRTFPANADCYCVAFSPDAQLLAAGSGGRDWESSGAITIWDLETGVERLSLPGHGAKDMAFSPDGKRLATGGTDRTVRIWDVASGQEALTLRGHTDYVRTVAFTPDGHRLVSASDDRTVRIWDATPWQRGEKRGEDLVTLRGHTDGLNAVAFHPTEPRLVTGGNDGIVRTWDRETGRELRSQRTGFSAVQTLVFSPDGDRLAFGGAPGESQSGKSATVVETSSGKQVQTLGAHVEDIGALAFSPDGKRLASGGTGDEVMISDINSGDVIHRLEGHGFYVMEIVFSPDPAGRLIASAGSDGMVHLWDTTTGRELDASPLRHQGIVDGLAISPDGQFLASAAGDGLVRIWNTKTWEQSQTLPTNGFLRCLAYSPDGERLAWGTNNALTQVWHKPSGEIHSLRGHLNSVRSVAFSPDGKLIASASQDGTAKIWQVPRHDAKSSRE